MPPDSYRLVTAAGLSRAPVRRIGAWPGAALRLAACWILLIALFFAQWRAMADQWWNISTYSHVLLVPLIVAWLVWQRAAGLRQLPAPVGWWPGLLGFGAAVALWLLGSLGGLAEAQQAGAVAMLIAAVPTLLGLRIATALRFPLAYMVFLVPVGDEAVPLLQTIDAQLTVAMLHFSHVRATLDGVFIATPAGLFEIAEACSGVKFLVAMVAFGVLAAHVCFVSWRRRLIFLVASVVVPVLANGMRSWATVYIAQSMGVAWAGGFDHIVYGWIFFAIVIGGTLAASWRFFDRPPHAPLIDVPALAASPLLARLARQRLGPSGALAGVLALALGAQLWAGAADRLAAPTPVRIDWPEVPGWHRAPYTPQPWWEPRGGGADHRLLGRYADDRGHVVDAFFALYATSGPGHKADGTGEGAVRRDSGWSWQGPGPAVPGAASDRLLAAGPTLRLAETTYHSGDLVSGSRLALRISSLENRLLLRARPTMLLILSAEAHPGQRPEDAIAAFRTSIGPLGTWMDQVARDRKQR